MLNSYEDYLLSSQEKGLIQATTRFQVCVLRPISCAMALRSSAHFAASKLFLS